MTCSFPFVLMLARAGARLASGDDPFPAASPESQGIAAAALEQLQSEVRGLVARDTIVGAELLVIKNRRTVLHEAYGWRDRDAKIAMQRDTIFNIRSMSKPFTGAAVQMLIDDGDLEVTDTVAAHLDCFDRDATRAITVQQLLSHRGGLPLTMLTTSIDQYPDLHAMACAAAAAPPQFPPGSRFWYSDAGTDVLGAVVEQISGENLARFLRERLFAPLGMADTLHLNADGDARWARVASLYIGRPGHWQRFWKPAGKPFYGFAWGSQSVYSTPRDYARFLALWMDRGRRGDVQVLSDAAVTRTLTPVCEMSQLGSDARYPSGFPDLVAYYGQMAIVYVDAEQRPVVIGHSGSDGTWAWAWPAQDLMVLYFTQSRGQVTGVRLERLIDQLLVQRERKPEPPAPPEIAPLLGEYLADFAAYRDEPWQVRYERGRLVVDIPSQIAVTLSSADANGQWTFDSPAKQAVRFERDDRGDVDAMLLREGPLEYCLPRLGREQHPPSYPDDVARCLGRYHNADGTLTAEIAMRDGWLVMDWPGETAYELLAPDAKGVWPLRASRNLTIQFDGGDAKQAAWLVYRQPGREMKMMRVDGAQ
ncbi:MAG: serine hydrolase domain-containing protein [Planctomycetota bacterium]